jgi:preprotein translocase subunit SecG
MSFLVGILTLILVLNCLLLILLVLVQLPKKDAGAGMAFGAGAADALFGAGSGNALTKITKYATGIFLVLALLLGHMQDSLHRENGAADFAKQVQQKQNQTPAVTTTPTPATPAANSLLLTTPATNASK